MLEISNEDFDTLRRLEETLWQTQSRFDGAHMEEALAPDFFEFFIRARRIAVHIIDLFIKQMPRCKYCCVEPRNFII